MRHSFRITVAVIAMQTGQMVGMHVKAVEKKGRPKADGNASLMASLADAIGNDGLDQIARAKAQVRLVALLGFGSRKAKFVHPTHLPTAMSCSTNEQWLHP